MAFNLSYYVTRSIDKYDVIENCIYNLYFVEETEDGHLYGTDESMALCRMALAGALNMTEDEAEGVVMQWLESFRG